MRQLKGVFPVPVTPFKETDQAVDYAMLEKHIDFLMSSGVHGIVVNGSTSEAAMLNDDEFMKVARTIFNRVDGKLPIIVGATAPSTLKTIAYCKMAEDLGADALLMLPPYFFPANESEIRNHYETIAGHTDLPIVVYNNPNSSGIDIKPDLVAKLAQIDNVLYIKEATGEIARVYEIKALAGDTIDVLAGSDNVFFDALIAGAVGSIAASGNVVPAQMANVYETVVEKGDIAGGRALFKKIFPICNLIDGSPSFVQVVKTSLEIMQQPCGVPRGPMLPLAGEERRQLIHVLKDLDRN